MQAAWVQHLNSPRRRGGNGSTGAETSTAAREKTKELIPRAEIAGDEQCAALRRRNGPIPIAEIIRVEESCTPQNVTENTTPNVPAIVAVQRATSRCHSAAPQTPSYASIASMVKPKKASSDSVGKSRPQKGKPVSVMPAQQQRQQTAQPKGLNSASEAPEEAPISSTVAQTRAADPCILCGCVLTDWMQRRFKPLQVLARLIQESCLPTPFVYAEIMQAAQRERELLSGSSVWPNVQSSSRSESVLCCVPCISWVHRTEKECLKKNRMSGALLQALASVCCSSPRQETDVVAVADGCVSDQESVFSCGQPDAVATDSDRELGLEYNDILGEDDIPCEDDDDDVGRKTGNGGSSSQDCSGSEVDNEDIEEACDEAGDSSATNAASSSSNQPEISDGSSILNSRKWTIIPTDHVIMFMSHPGDPARGGTQPDLRLLYRVMCSLNAAPISVHGIPVRNQYLKFCSPLVRLILHMFGSKYANVVCSQQQRQGAGGGGGVASPQPSSTVMLSRRVGKRKGVHGSGGQREGSCAVAVVSDDSQTLVTDILQQWWVGAGMPTLLPDPTTAKMLREALGSDLDEGK